MGTKESLLSMLRSRRGEFISGAEIAGELGISGTAVWKAVNRLKKDGYMIDSVTNKGYRLSADSDILTAEAVMSYLDPDVLSDTDESGSFEIEVFGSVDSTNNIAKSKASAGGTGSYVAVASCQTSGRGRRGRSFFSPEGSGLYLSILLRPPGYSSQQAVRFTTMAAVAVCEAIEEVSGRSAAVKWVNDIFMDERKVCGILTEASFDLESGLLDYAVVGIGVNVFAPEGGFPESIRDTAGAVFAGHDDPVSKAPDIRSRLAAAIISRFAAYYKAPNSVRIEEYRKRCFVIGRNITVHPAGSEPRNALALDIDNECGLIVRYEDDTQETLSSGEISIRL